MNRVIHGLMAAAAVSLVALSVTGSAALAAPATTHAPSATVTELAEGAQDGPVKVEVDGPARVNFREITLPPGAATGKHCHYGQLVAVVKSGALTHYAPVYPGGVHTYRAGESLVEGPGYVHEGRNEGTQDVVLLVTYVTPQGKPLAESDLSKCEVQR